MLLALTLAAAAADSPEPVPPEVVLPLPTEAPDLASIASVPAALDQRDLLPYTATAGAILTVAGGPLQFALDGRRGAQFGLVPTGNGLALAGVW